MAVVDLAARGKASRAFRDPSKQERIGMASPTDERAGHPPKSIEAQSKSGNRKGVKAIVEGRKHGEEEGLASGQRRKPCLAQREDRR